MANLFELIQQMNSLQMQVKNNIEQITTAKKEIVFLPWKASCWNAMESVWRAAAADPDCEVYVVPIPWYYRNNDGSVQSEPQYEGDLFPSYVPITSYKDFDLTAHHPYMTIFQNPYDYCNYSTSVVPEYFARSLKASTENLVYIPWFATDEINFNDPQDGKSVYNMRYYVTVPGVVHADMVVVQSELVREAYIEVLTQFAGDDTRAHWESKVFGFGSPLLLPPEAGSDIWANIKRVSEQKAQKEQHHDKLS